jgi:WD40 repeat protein
MKKINYFLPQFFINLLNSKIFITLPLLGLVVLGNIAVFADIVTKPIHTFQGHTDYVESVAFTPDGKTILSGSLDNTLKLWNLETGQEINTLSGHRGWVMSVAVSNDGKQALSGSYDKTLKLWDIETGQEIYTFTGHTRSVVAVAFSPDNKMVLSGSGDKTLILWDIATGQQVHTFKGHTNVISSVAFTPEGEMALSGSYDKTLKLWNLKSGQEIRTFQGHTGKIWSIAFAPTEYSVLSGSGDYKLKQWQIHTGKELRTLQGHTDKIWDIAISPDGKTVVSGSEDKTLRLWDLKTEQEIRLFQHATPIRALAFSPDGNYILVGSTDNTLKLWGTYNATPNANFIVFPNKGVAPLTVNLDGSLSTDTDGIIINYRWWTSNEQDIPTNIPTTTMTFEQPGTYTINLAVTDNANQISTSTAQQTVTVEEANTPPTVTFMAIPPQGKMPLTVTFDATGSFDADGSIIKYEWSLNEQVLGTEPQITHTFSAVGEYLVQLTVTDEQGLITTAQQNVSVTSPNQIPVALFTATPLVGEAPLTVILNARESFDPNGEIVNYEWTINGQKLSGMMASCLLTNPGKYLINLKITDNQGTSTQAQQTVTIIAPNQTPTARFTAIPLSGIAPLVVTLDASSSVDPDGSIVNYKWDLNDQLLAYGNPTTHTFTETGELMLTLTITDNQGATAKTHQNLQVIAPNQIPTASFTVTPTTGQAPLTVTLDASSSTDSDGSIINYKWSVNEQLLAYGNPTTHTFTEAGEQLITLTVIDNQKASATAQQKLNITWPNQKPVAHITATPLTGTAPLTVNLDASRSVDPDGEIVQYEWLINDQKLSGMIASTTLTSDGEYLVVLTITDNQGLTVSAQTNLHVTALPQESSIQPKLERILK